MCALLVALGVVEDWKNAERLIQERRPYIRMNALHREALEEWSKDRISSPMKSRERDISPVILSNSSGRTAKKNEWHAPFITLTIILYSTGNILLLHMNYWYHFDSNLIQCVMKNSNFNYVMANQLVDLRRIYSVIWMLTSILCVAPLFIWTCSFFFFFLDDWATFILINTPKNSKAQHF